MKRLLICLLLLVSSALAQNRISGSISASGSTCGTTNACVSLQTGGNAGSVMVVLTGSFTATLQFEVSNDGGGNWSAATAIPVGGGASVTSATATGAWRITAGGITDVRVRCSAFTSGPVGVKLSSGQGSAAGGGGTFDTLQGGTNTFASMVVGSGATLDYSGTGTIAATSTANANSTTNASFFPLFVGTQGGDYPAFTNVSFLFNPSSGLLTVPGSLGTGTAPTSCGSATGCFGATAASTASTQTASQGSLRLDSTSGFWLIRHVNAATESPAAQVIAAGTAAMNTAAIASGACATVVTDGTVTKGAVANVATTDVILYTPAADPTGVTAYAVSATGSVYIWAYPTAGHVNFKVCNNTSGSLTPGALTLNWQVTR